MRVESDESIPTRRLCLGFWRCAALGVCGDWLDGGRVEGAWMSGRELAQRVLHWMRVR